MFRYSIAIRQRRDGPPSGGEKGSRCETGAVPATVSGEPISFKATGPHSGWEGGKTGADPQSQETCHRARHETADRGVCAVRDTVCDAAFGVTDECFANHAPTPRYGRSSCPRLRGAFRVFVRPCGGSEPPTPPPRPSGAAASPSEGGVERRSHPDSCCVTEIGSRHSAGEHPPLLRSRSSRTVSSGGPATFAAALRGFRGRRRFFVRRPARRLRKCIV